MSSTVDYRSAREAREHFKEILDAADDGRPATVTRDARRVAAVDADRLVHFLYGLLIAYPIREMFLRIGNVRGFWGYFLPLDLTMSTSMLYELIEWGTAVTVGKDLGQAYLGTQGDVWDAHNDIQAYRKNARSAETMLAVEMRVQRPFPWMAT